MKRKYSLKEQAKAEVYDYLKQLWDRDSPYGFTSAPRWLALVPLLAIPVLYVNSPEVFLDPSICWFLVILVISIVLSYFFA
jgi:hypothetical protein